MSSQAMTPPDRKCPEAPIIVEAESDQGVTTRLLALLGSENRFPTSFSLERRGNKLLFTLGLPNADARCAKRLVTQLRRVPGVREVSAPPARAA